MDVPSLVDAPTLLLLPQALPTLLVLTTCHLVLTDIEALCGLQLLFIWGYPMGATLSSSLSARFLLHILDDTLFYTPSITSNCRPPPATSSPTQQRTIPTPTITPSATTEKFYLLPASSS
ncbi:hypothetical protein Salat_2574600 [Sesamum alatum]|uniref:Uncharacterized protein n=1 Tax=Sesamum alatum TaxID=300844 RepID=A0AAE1XT10_9LAMI|nr:hypothetical protein Salat_2574600 [Sesamum alatum]